MALESNKYSKNVKTRPFSELYNRRRCETYVFLCYLYYRIWMKRNDIKIESVLPFAIILRMFISCLIPILFQFNSNITLILIIGVELEINWR